MNSFSCSGALRLPHEARNVTTMEYSVWLDASSAGEVAGAVRDCAGSKTGLDASVEAIRMNVLEMCS